MATVGTRAVRTAQGVTFDRTASTRVRVGACRNPVCVGWSIADQLAPRVSESGTVRDSDSRLDSCTTALRAVRADELVAIQAAASTRPEVRASRQSLLVVRTFIDRLSSTSSTSHQRNKAREQQATKRRHRHCAVL